MTAEKYVSAITKKIQCSGSTKKDIKRQLLADIQTELARGEDLEEILSRMGSVEEIAEDFNENLTEKEKKQYTVGRILKICGCILLVLIVLAVLLFWKLPKATSLSDSAYFDEAQIEARMQEVVLLINEENYSALQENVTEQMRQILTPETMNAAKAQVAEGWGDFVNFAPAYMSEITQGGEHYALGQMNVTYTNVSVTYTLTFDQQGKLAGLFMK